MDHQFITIKQATERYAVADITLRRLVRDITKNAAHEQREFVRPSAADLDRFRKENRPFEYEISTKLLALRYAERDQGAGEGTGRVADVQDAVGSAAMGVLESTNELLREQLKVKDEQIRQLNDSLRAMQQQQTATTAVLVRLSERLPLLAERTSAERQSPAVVHSDPEHREAKPKTSAKRKEAIKRATHTATRRGLWAWLRREPRQAMAGK
jgi:hypothetical protein